MDTVSVNVEYCVPCGYAKQFQELSKSINVEVPKAQITSSEGKTGAFEVSVNGKLLHSSLKMVSFPDYSDVARIVKEVSLGAEIPSMVKQQPINDCHIS